MKNKIFIVLENPEVRQIFFYSFILLVAGYVLFINLLMPLVGEDYTMQPWRANSSPPSFGLQIKAVFHTVYYSAIMWNPRIGEALTTITAAFPKLLFDIINSLLFIWLIVVLFVLGYGRYPSSKRHSDLFAMASIVFLIFTYFPLLGQVFFWKAGATNHLWGAILILSFILPFRFNITNKIEVRRLSSLILYIILGFFAGLTIENVSPVVFGTLLIYYLISCREDSIDRKFIFPLLSNAIGVIILLFSPGTTFRRNYYSEFGYDGEYSGIAMYFNRFIRVNADFFKSTWPLLVIFCVCLLIFVVVHKQKNHEEGRKIPQDKSTLPTYFITLLMAYLSVLILITISYQSDQRRGFTFFWLVVIGLTAHTMTEIWSILGPKRRLIPVAFLITISAVQMFKIGMVYSQFNIENAKRMELVYSAVNNGQKEIVLPAITTPDSRMLETREILSDLGVRIATYYNLDNVEIQK